MPLPRRSTAPADRRLGRRLVAAALTLGPAAGSAALAPHPAGAATAPATALTAPAVPPAQVCGSAGLAGPAVAPVGATTVPAGDNSTFNFSVAGATFWFAPGVHTFGSSIYGQIRTADNATYVGGPGAVLDGGHVNRTAFGVASANVTVRYLTVRNFGTAGGTQNEGVVNHDLGADWTIEFNTISANAGAGAMLGDGDTLRYNCLTGNGQYGFSVFEQNGAHDITIDHNEIAANNADDWETRQPGCGCSGGGKLWATTGAVITNNWVHDNKAVGIFVDNDNTGFRIEGNYIEDNSAEAIVYEISYNARIAGNTIRGNAITKGKAFAARGDNFPVGAVYISESGGDSRVGGGVYSTLEVTGNDLIDNWGGVILWENADRFCGSTATGNTTTCTLGGAASQAKCVSGTINSAPYFSDCRWKTQNVWVHDNDLSVDRSAIGCGTSAMCAQEGLLSNYGSAPSWSPYKGRTVQNAITYSQNNRFTDNRYAGDWRFLAWEPGNFLTLDGFQAAPYAQEAGSTQVGITGAAATQVPDAATATLEGSIGHWTPWFAANAARSTARAHTGGASLRVDVTAPNGWGVHLDNDPGFAISPGAKTVSFWGSAASGTGLAATLTVKWRNSSGADLQTDTATIPSLGQAWSRGFANVTAPAGTAFVSIAVTNSAGVAGNTMFFDDFSIADSTAVGALTAPLDGQAGVDTTAPFTWASAAGAQAYALAVGTTRFGGDLVASGVLPASQTAFAVPALPTDQPLFATLLTQVAGTWRYSEATFTAAPGMATFTYPTPGQVGVDGQKFTWSTIPQAQAYALTVGTVPYGTDLANSGILGPSQSSFTVPALPVGRALYATLLTETNGAWTRFQSAPFVAANPAAHLTSPTDGQANVDLSRPFTWAPGPAAQGYVLTIGTTKFGTDLLRTGVLPATQTSATVPLSLPCGTPLYATLLTQVAGTWSFDDVPFSC